MPKIPVSAGDRTPIADALTRATEQHQNRFIAAGQRGVDQLLNRRGLQDLREHSRNTAAEAITLSLARRQIAPDHPVTQLFGEKVPRGWVDAALPRAAPIFSVAADAVLKIGREHAQPMVDRAWLSGHLRRLRANSTFLRA